MELLDTFYRGACDQIRAMLGTAARSGWMVQGRTALAKAVDGGRIALVLVASDASPSLFKEISLHTDKRRVPCTNILSVSDFSLYGKGKPIAVVGISHRGLARRMDEEIFKALSLTRSRDEWEQQREQRRLTAHSVDRKMPQHKAGAQQGRS
jgi:ribosomal protein L7Ae-like RNA K-turn-binding protein